MSDKIGRKFGMVRLCATPTSRIVLIEYTDARNWYRRPLLRTLCRFNWRAPQRWRPLGNALGYAVSDAYFSPRPCS